MTSEPQNKLLARRVLKEVVNTGAVDRLADFLAPEYVAPVLGIVGMDPAHEHMLMFRRCYPDMVAVEGQVAEGDIVATWYVMRTTPLGAFDRVPATGKRITLPAVTVQRIREGPDCGSLGRQKFTGGTTGARSRAMGHRSRGSQHCSPTRRFTEGSEETERLPPGLSAQIIGLSPKYRE